MRASCKRNVLGIMMDAVDYRTALDFVFEAAGEKRGSAISALAVHGLTTAFLSDKPKFAEIFDELREYTEGMDPDARAGLFGLNAAAMYSL